jgi:WD40 repeat protein
LPRLAAPLTALAFAPDGRTLAAGLADRTIELLDLAGAPPQFLHGHPGRITALAFAPDGKTLASASSNETLVRRWNWRERKELKRLPGFEREVLCLAFDPAGKRLAAGSMDGMGLVFGVESD